MPLLEFLAQTLSPSFKIGINNVVQWLNNTGVLEARNADGSALTQIRAADPVGNTDVATKGWTNTQIASVAASNAVREYEIPIGHADLGDTTTTVVDSPDIPLNGNVQSIDVKVTEAFNNVDSVKVGITSDDDAFIEIGQLSLGLVGQVQSFNFRSPLFEAAAPVKFTFVTSGDPDAGSLSAWITYSVPAAS